MNPEYRMTILTNDKECFEAIPQDSSIKVLSRPSTLSAKSGNIFVLTTATKLPEVTDFVRIANEYHRLRALFIHMDIDAKLLPQMLDRANLRVLRNTLVHAGPELPHRVMQAWKNGMQDKLIATAEVAQNLLLLITCALETLEVSFNEVAALRKIPISDRQHFKISSEGSYIHWPNQDIHLDVESLRYATDNEWRKLQDIHRLNADRRFAAAIANLRKARGIKQSGISGLSERQVRRIESGEPTTAKALECLAKSHGLSLNHYLNKIALRMETIPSLT